VGEDGVTRLGGRAEVPLTRAVTVTARDEAAGRWELAADDLADIVPGVVFEGRAAVDVEHHVTAGKTRSVLWSAGRVPEASRQLGALKALVQLLTPELRYRGVWEYRIVSQSGERLDLQPTRSTLGLPDLQRVRVRPGVPGCSADHKLGATCLVSFVNCDPGRPVVVGFEDADGAGFEPDMLAFQGGTRAVARVGDPVQMFFPASMAVTGTVDGLAFVGTCTIVTPGHGIIQAGAPKVRA
jgi:hypothetical protein